jgi:hypothetical protein
MTDQEAVQWLNENAPAEMRWWIHDRLRYPPLSIPTMKAEPTNAERLPGEYLATYRRAMDALHDVIDAINAMPVPGSESVTWGSVADIDRIAQDLEAVFRYTR